MMPAEKSYFNADIQKFTFEGKSTEFRDPSAAEREAAHLLKMADAFADDMALRYIADEACPKDVKEFGARHKIPLFAQVLWREAFMHGWKAALKAAYAVEESKNAERLQGVETETIITRILHNKHKNQSRLL